MIDKQRTGVCILSAGFSSRMGAFKPLLPIGDECALERIIRIFRNAGLKHIAVVTGHNRQELQPVIDKYGAIEAYNENFEQGMFTSIQAGLRAMPDMVEGVFLMPVDCPLVEEETLEILISNAREGDEFFVPCYKGKKGHPLYIPKVYREEILSYDGPGGLKGVTDRYFEKMQRIETGRESCVMDMDTMESYEEIRQHFARGFESEDLRVLAEGRTLLLVRHGQIVQHREKIFLGQTDIGLSELGREQACGAAQEIKKFLDNEVPQSKRPDRIYSSDLTRAADTAAEIGRQIEASVMQVPALREINLGSWDGMFISEVKKQFPKEYELRGENLRAFKIGNKSENFYDLDYRVYKGMKKILKEDSSEIMIIVSHKGVIESILRNLDKINDKEYLNKPANGNIIYVLL